VDAGTADRAAHRRGRGRHNLGGKRSVAAAKKQLKPWPVRQGCIPKLTAALIERMEAILDLYAQAYNPERPMVCFDEKMTQLLSHIREPLPLTPKAGRRQDYEYRRGGTRNRFMFVEPKAGRRAVLVTRQRGKRDFAQAMRYLVDVLYPNAPIIDVVLDNLNTHTYLALVETFGKIEADRMADRLCFHYTPAHGSWLNRAEIELSIRSRQCLNRRLPDEWTLGLEIIAWENQRNQRQAKIHWRFSVDDARRVFRDHYPAFSSC
jgi:hypothetical protein